MLFEVVIFILPRGKDLKQLQQMNIVQSKVIFVVRFSVSGDGIWFANSHNSCQGPTGSLSSDFSSEEDDDSVFDEDDDDDDDGNDRSSLGNEIHPVKRATLFYFDEDGDISAGGGRTQTEHNTPGHQLGRKGDNFTIAAKGNNRGPSEQSKLPRRVVTKGEKREDNATFNPPGENIKVLDQVARGDITPPIIVEMWDSGRLSYPPCGDGGAESERQPGRDGFNREEREPTPFMPGPTGNPSSSQVNHGSSLAPPTHKPAVKFEREATPTPELSRKKYDLHLRVDAEEQSVKRASTPLLPDSDFCRKERGAPVRNQLSVDVPGPHTSSQLSVAARQYTRPESINSNTKTNNPVEFFMSSNQGVLNDCFKQLVPQLVSDASVPSSHQVHETSIPASDLKTVLHTKDAASATKQAAALHSKGYNEGDSESKIRAAQHLALQPRQINPKPSTSQVIDTKTKGGVTRAVTPIPQDKPREEMVTPDLSGQPTDRTSSRLAQTNALGQATPSSSPGRPKPSSPQNTQPATRDTDHLLEASENPPVIASRPPLDTSYNRPGLGSQRHLGPCDGRESLRSVHSFTNSCVTDAGDSCASDSGNSQSARSSSAWDSTSAPEADVTLKLERPPPLDGVPADSSTGSRVKDGLFQGWTVFMSVIEWIVLPPLPQPDPATSDQSSSSEAGVCPSTSRREDCQGRSKRKLKPRPPRLSRRRQSRESRSKSFAASAGRDRQKTGATNTLSHLTLREILVECSPFGRHTSLAVLFILVMTLICLTLQVPVGKFLCYVVACFYAFCVLRHIGVLE